MNLVLMIKENAILGPPYRILHSAISVVPYYLVREFLVDKNDLNINPRIEISESTFLDHEEIKVIAGNPEVPETEVDLLDRLRRSCRCFGLKLNKEIIAYTWCNLEKIHYYGLNITLDSDEAYLFDARTFQAYRGKNLAPYLRYELYKKLAKLGRTKFYSASSVLNSSAIKFKAKLGAKIIRLYVGIRILNRIHWNILLRNYV